MGTAQASAVAVLSGARLGHDPALAEPGDDQHGLHAPRDRERVDDRLEVEPLPEQRSLHAGWEPAAELVRVEEEAVERDGERDPVRVPAR